MNPTILNVQQLSIHFSDEKDIVQAVDNNSFIVKKGEIIGIVGESGSGKSITALSILQLLPKTAKMTSGRILFQPDSYTDNNQVHHLTKLSTKEIASLRGHHIAMIFQEPMTALNPVMTCGKQVTEAIMLHQSITKQAAKKLTLDLFEKVKLPDILRIYTAYPHQLSGGQKQRIMIAMAISSRPSLLIADEPTTALDVTVQREIINLLKELSQEYNLAILFISHDLGVIKQIADSVLVMRAGKIVEQGQVIDIFDNPQHSYTKGLLACRPALNQHLRRLPTLADFAEKAQRKTVLSANTDSKKEIYQQNPILKINQLATWYPSKRNFLGKPIEYVKAVDGVSFEVYEKETFGIVGESGCGKSTLGRTILGLETPKGGSIHFEGQDILNANNKSWQQLRRKMQIIFQDPYSSLNPSQPIGYAIMEPMKLHRLWKNDKQYREKTIELLKMVGLDDKHFHRFPHEFSGGQRQRIAIARALAVQPKLLICDECVSSLDVSIQAQILNLLLDLQDQLNLTIIFVSHDLSVVRFISDRIMVMQNGKAVEIGAAEKIYNSPQHPYTKQLIEAIP